MGKGDAEAGAPRRRASRMCDPVIRARVLRRPGAPTARVLRVVARRRAGPPAPEARVAPEERAAPEERPRAAPPRGVPAPSGARARGKGLPQALRDAAARGLAPGAPQPHAAARGLAPGAPQPCMAPEVKGATSKEPPGAREGASAPAVRPPAVGAVLAVLTVVPPPSGGADLKGLRHGAPRGAAPPGRPPAAPPVGAAPRCRAPPVRAGRVGPEPREPAASRAAPPASAAAIARTVVVSAAHRLVPAASGTIWPGSRGTRSAPGRPLRGRLAPTVRRCGSACAPPGAGSGPCPGPPTGAAIPGCAALG